MSFPAQFRYGNEDDFIQRFLIPLINRMGFHVVNYHGASEFGKDLVFAEIDRFGHVRYHGLQAKYESSISLKDSECLVDDCRQAFANPFKHPQTGVTERISTFYAVNGGSISEQATTHFFNSTINYGGNVRLIDGKSLVALDRWATLTRSESIGPLLSGLLAEIQYNKMIMSEHLATIDNFIKGNSTDLPIGRLQGAAVSNYLVRPICSAQIDVATVASMARHIENHNNIMIFCLQSLAPLENKLRNSEKIKDESVKFYLWNSTVESQIVGILDNFGPLSGM